MKKLILLFLFANILNAQTPTTELDSLPVLAQKPNFTLEKKDFFTFSPVLDISKNLEANVSKRSEMQSDISFKGSMFENSGVMIGNANIYDPQTGHYLADFPVPAIMLEKTNILSGTENAMQGFNSTSASAKWDFKDLEDTAILSAGIGSYGLLFQEAYVAKNAINEESKKLGADFTFNRSEASGPFENSSHLLERYAGRIFGEYGKVKANLFAGYQSKDYEWDNMYYPATIVMPESEALQTTLFLFDSSAQINDYNDIAFSAYYRRNKDDYRMNPNIYQALHESEVYQASISGKTGIENLFATWKIIFSQDNIDSTALFVNPPYQGGKYSRTFVKMSMLPTYELPLDGDSKIAFKAGANFDISNRYSNRLNPVAKIEYENSNNKIKQFYAISYSESSALPSYTAIGSRTGGPWGGNPDLGRQVNRNYEIQSEFAYDDLTVKPRFYFRQDRDIYDWIFDATSPSLRIAQELQGDVFGFEIEFEYVIKEADLKFSLGYAYMNKSIDYPAGTTSFYYGDYADNKILFSMQWDFLDDFAFIWKNAYIHQVENNLRTSTRNPVMSEIKLEYSPSFCKYFSCAIAVSNLYNTGFQEIPGVRPYPRTISAYLTFKY